MSALESPVWESGDPLGLPEVVGDIAADVCVVGLGGSGLACVHRLLEAGKQVVGIDAVRVAGGAAGRNGGFLLGGLALFHHDVVQQFGRHVARAIYDETLIQIDRMIEETPAAINRVGTLRIAIDDEELADCGRQYDAMRADDLAVEQYDGPEGRGLLFPRDAAFDPWLRCKTLARRALSSGARLFGRSPALEIGEGRVVTPRGSVVADRVIVTVDGALETIFPEMNSRARSARLQMLATAPVPDLTLPRPVYARWGLDYWQQRPDGRVVLGGCRDVGGESEWTTNTRPTAVVQDALESILRERLAVTAPVTHRWGATVAYTQTGMPILEEARPGVWAVGGYSGTGNVIGALCGRAAADIAVTGQSAFAELLAGQGAPRGPDAG